MTTPNFFTNEIKQDVEVQHTPMLQNNQQAFTGQGLIPRVGGVTFRDSNIGQRTLVARDGSEIQKRIDELNDIGGGIVFLKNGEYLLDDDIVLYSNVYLEGENQQSCVINFQSNAKQIKIVGSNAYTTGTVSISNNGTTVTGVGTSWLTNATAGQYIMLDGIWYPIAAVSSDTSITISLPFAGVTLSGASYTIATPIIDADVRKITVKNSTTSAFKIQYGLEIRLEHCDVQASLQAVDADDTSQLALDECDWTANFVGATLDNVHYTTIDISGSIDALSGAGCTITNCSNMAVDKCFFLNSAGNGMTISGSNNINIMASASIENGGIGIELSSSNSDITISGCAFENNASDGVKFTATTDDCFLSFSSTKDNGGYGVNIAASTCDRNNITGNNISGNTSGAINDAGTDTVIRGNVGYQDNTSDTVTLTAGQDITAGNAVMLHSDNKVYPTNALRADDATYFIGFATTTATSGNSVQVRVSGVANNLSGLTTRTKYYIQDIGTAVETENTTSNTTQAFGTSEGAWQSFTIGGSDITCVAVRFNMAVITSRPLTVTIRTGEGLAGGVVHTETFNQTFVTGTDNICYFAVPFDLSASTQYTLTAYHSSGTSGDMSWSEQSSGDVYSGGRNSNGPDRDYRFGILVQSGTDFGAIGTSAGTNSRVVGRTLGSTDELQIDKADY